MRWHLRRREPVAPIADDADEHVERKAAHDKALDDIANIDARWAEVHAISGELREIRTRNHFAEQIENIFAPGRNKQ